MKKIVAILLVFILAICIIPFGQFQLTVSAATSGNYTYKVSDGKAVITDVDTSISGDVIIPKKMGSYMVSEIGDNAFYNCSKMTSITIPSEIESIGANAFAFCENLQSVVLPDSIISIGKGAFSDCVNLNSITIPKEVKIIDELTFSNCTNLTSVITSDGVTEIGKYAFSWCEGLREISLDNIVTLGEGAFYYCKNLKTVNLGNKLTAIEASAFYNCTSLEMLDLKNGVTKIGNSAFEKCNSFYEIKLPASIETIESYAFNECNNFTNVLYSGDEAQRESISIGKFNEALTKATWAYNVCETGEHNYDDICDAICNKCGVARKVNHSYDDALDESCNLCGQTREIKSWKISPEATAVFNVTPSKTLSNFTSKTDLIVFDKQGKEVKYNDTKKGWPLVSGGKYTVKLKKEFNDIDDLNWKLTKLADTIFPDTSKNDWYHDSVTYAVGAGIMSGYQSGKFGTSDSIQRQDFLVMLARYEGVDLNKYNYKSKFSDVARNGYYEAAVNWGAENGIVTGYNNGKFGVGDKVTREQLVTFLYRYAKYKGINTTCTTAEQNIVKNTYSDYKSVSAFAQDAIVWAVTYGVIGGKTPTTIVPQGNAQRCEVAKIMYNIYLNDIF